jgi:peptide-methionine (S)-S-oxide reductase
MQKTFVAALLMTATAFAKGQPFPPPAADDPLAPSPSKQTAVLAGGCFWGMEGVFERLKGVTNVVSGFAGGERSTAHYEEVSSGTTGHAESVQITYDPSRITFGQLLMVYFSVAHDPTELNRQGPDSGSQYRSAVFFMNDDQKRITEAYVHQLDSAHVYSRPIVTQIVPYKGFYAAEKHHQHFLDNNPDYPYIVYNDLPKLAALKKQYPQMCKR